MSQKHLCCEPREVCAHSQGVSLIPQLGFTGLDVTADRKVGSEFELVLGMLPGSGQGKAAGIKQRWGINGGSAWAFLRCCSSHRMQWRMSALHSPVSHRPRVHLQM